MMLANLKNVIDDTINGDITPQTLIIIFMAVLGSVVLLMLCVKIFY
jgi:hypothetical protein